MRVVYGTVHTMEHLTLIHVLQIMMPLSFVKVDFSFSNITYLFSIIDNTTQPVNCKTGDIRLIGRTEDYEGRLEVCINHVWGTVCSIGWDDRATKVACRQLGYQEIGLLSLSRVCYNIILYVSLIGGVTYYSKTYGQGLGPIMFGNIQCNGNEDSIFDCNRNVFLFTSSYCSNHYYDLVLKCERKRIISYFNQSICTFHRCITVKIKFMISSYITLLHKATNYTVCNFDNFM